MSNRVTILGTSSATPTKTRRHSGHYLQMGGHNVLIDCGEGTQNRLMKHKLSYQKLSHVFISHLHGDHFLGLFPLISTMNLQNRTQPLTIVAPYGLKRVLDVLNDVMEAEIHFPVHFISLEKTNEIIDLEHLTVMPFPLKHRIPCYGFRFEEKRQPRKLNVQNCKEYGVPIEDYASLVAGQDWKDIHGRTVANKELTDDGPKPASYVYITDTLFDRAWIDKAANANLLYHEATYLDMLVDKAHERFHTTAKEAAIFAREAGVDQLIIGHFSGIYKDLEAHLTEARNIFPNSDLAKEGQVFEIINGEEAE